MDIVEDIMLLDVDRSAFDMQQIDNRRFMYSPKYHQLVLGKQYEPCACLSSAHSVEFAESGAQGAFDEYLRGWIGCGGEYPHGVIHFAPDIDPKNAEQMARGFDALEMFRKNGAVARTVVRGYGAVWERPLSTIT